MVVDSKVIFTSLTSLFAVLTISVFWYQKRKKVNIPGKWKQIGNLEKIDLYPLKSGQRVELHSAECTEFGLQEVNSNNSFRLRDRSFVVYAEKDREFRTGRTYPKMVLINVCGDSDNYIIFNAPSMRTLRMKIPSRSEANQLCVKVRGEEIPAFDCGDEAAAWFSQYILEKQSGLRLGYNEACRKRDISQVHKALLDYYPNLSNYSTGLYSDLTSFTIVNKASVNDLNTRIYNEKISVENFRANFVVDGLNIQPYDEDRWEWIKIGDVVFRNVKECTRCILTTIDPKNATRRIDRQPLKSLEKYRMTEGPQKSPIMGIHCEVRKAGIVHIGDTVHVAA